jgi:hypothetical protein
MFTSPHPDQRPKRAVTAAITAAVMTYIKNEAESRKSVAVSAVPTPVAAAAGSFYGASGRQQMMEMRRLLSLRMGRR